VRRIVPLIAVTENAWLAWNFSAIVLKIAPVLLEKLTKANIRGKPSIIQNILILIVAIKFARMARMPKIVGKTVQRFAGIVFAVLGKIPVTVPLTAWRNAAMASASWEKVTQLVHRTAISFVATKNANKVNRRKFVPWIVSWQFVVMANA